MTSGIADRLDAVLRRVDTAVSNCGRDPAAITLISVGKTFPAEVVNEAVIAGATDLGENRVQEAVAKKPGVSEARWHLIGPLQRNKARSALDVFDIVHTVDRFEIADRLQYLLTEHWPERKLDVLLEINVAEELQKAGALPEDASELLEHDGARQVFHVTYGSALHSACSRGGTLGAELKDVLLASPKNEEVHMEMLERHFRRHLQPFTRGE